MGNSIVKMVCPYCEVKIENVFIEMCGSVE